MSCLLCTMSMGKPTTIALKIRVQHFEILCHRMNCISCCIKLILLICKRFFFYCHHARHIPFFVRAINSNDIFSSIILKFWMRLLFQVMLPERDSQNNSGLSRSNLKSFRASLTVKEIADIDFVLKGCGLPTCEAFPLTNEGFTKALELSWRHQDGNHFPGCSFRQVSATPNSAAFFRKAGRLHSYRNIERFLKMQLDHKKLWN